VRYDKGSEAGVYDTAMKRSVMSYRDVEVPPFDVGR